MKMVKNNKRRAFRFLPLLLVVSLLAACAGAGGAVSTDSAPSAPAVEAPASSDSGPESTSEAPADADEETVTISMYLVFDGVEYPQPGNNIQKMMEEYTNTKLEITAYGNYGDLYPTMLASGDLPDVLTTLDLPITKDAVKSGMFWDLAPYLPDTNNLKDYHPTTLENSSVDGKLIGIPKVRPLVRRTFVYRADWAEKLGLTPPANVDEMYEFFKAFAERDPDGNGQKDTYGLTIDKAFLKHMAFMFGAPNEWEVQGDQFVRNFTTPEYLEGMRFLRRLMEEGILHPEWATIPRNQFYSVFEDGVLGVMHDSTNAIQMLGARVEAKDPDAWVDAFTHIEDPNGETRTMGESGHLGWLSVPTTVPEDKVRRIVKFFDQTADDEMASLMVWGVEGTHYNVEDGKAVSIPEGAQNYEDTIRYPYKLPFSAVNYEDYARDGVYNRYVQRALDIDRAELEYMVPNPVYPLFSETYFEMSKTLDLIIEDASVKFINGAINEDQFLAEVEKWKTGGGDKVCGEFMEAYRVNNP